MSSARPSAARPWPGLAVRVRRVAALPVVAVRVWVRGGARAEALPGQALVAGRALAEGTRRRGWRAIADAADERGMGLAGFGATSVHGVGLDALAGDWELALDWAAELTLESDFAVDRCDWLRRQAGAELDAMADHPESVAGWAFLRQLYDPHPRGHPLQGTAETLERLTAADCADFHRRALRWGVVVCVAGAVDEEAVEERVRRLFAALPAVAETTPEPPPIDGLPISRQEVLAGGAGQCHLLAGHLTVDRAHADYAALDALSVILGAGAGLAGRIPHRIREREGLAYSAQAETVAAAGTDPGHLSIYVGTSVANLERAERALRDELARLLDGGISEAEVADARSYLLGREPFGRETARQQADILGRAEILGLPLDRPQWVRGEIEALDRLAIEAGARRHLDPDRLKVTVGLPARR